MKNLSQYVNQQLVICFGVLSVLVSATQVTLAAGFVDISPKDAFQLLQNDLSVQLVDVRTQPEYDYAHIENSILIPMRQLLGGEHKLSKGKPVLLYCAVGGRSYFAAQILVDDGFQKVYNMSGGIERWYQGGLPLIFQ